MEKTKIGRFQVMALLQAARYYLLTRDLKKAYSFGLNRAIFYAWAKRYGKTIPRSERETLTEKKEVITVKKGNSYFTYVGNECVPVSPNGWFTIGGKEQTPEDYKRNIISKIESVIPYEEAWKVALEYVGRFSKSVLLDQQKFFEKVYKPVRDNFLELVKRYKERRGLEQFLNKK